MKENEAGCACHMTDEEHSCSCGCGEENEGGGMPPRALILGAILFAFGLILSHMNSPMIAPHPYLVMYQLPPSLGIFVDACVS